MFCDLALMQGRGGSSQKADITAAPHPWPKSAPLCACARGAIALASGSWIAAPEDPRLCRRVAQRLERAPYRRVIRVQFPACRLMHCGLPSKGPEHLTSDRPSA